jgi:hypothetical protein
MTDKHDFKYPHLSLCVLETFFENDANNQVSVRPLIETYAHTVGVPIDPDEIEILKLDDKFHELSVSELLKSIVEMDAAEREKIFAQKNLSALTILLEVFVKAKINVIADAVALTCTDDADVKIADFRKRLETKGYIKKFNDAVMKDIFGKDVEMKRKKENNQVGVKAPGNNVAAEVIQTSTRRIQLFPALYGATTWGIMSVIGILSSVVLGFFTVAFMNQHDGMTSLNCEQLAQPQMTTTGQQVAASISDGMKAICSANADAPAIGYVFLFLTIAGLAVAIVGLVKFVKIIVHNQFASSHNGFELAHYTLTSK